MTKKSDDRTESQARTGPVTLTGPIAIPMPPVVPRDATAYVTTRIDATLTNDQAVAQRRLFDSLQAAVARLESGKVIASPADVYRWILEQYGKILGNELHTAELVVKPLPDMDVERDPAAGEPDTAGEPAAKEPDAGDADKSEKETEAEPEAPWTPDGKRAAPRAERPKPDRRRNGKGGA